ncbi:MAG: DUF1254 domain-containing protein [Candidatus Nanopelagicales bacterium]|nr:DUF1254 domain-containing protein [Candidatus Nanopelagicales bacterium]
MRWLRRAGLGLLVLVALAALAAMTPPGRALITEKRALRDGATGYLYGYPLVTMLETQRALTTPPAALNAFAHTRKLPEDAGVNVVRPSRDLLYSSAWLDLSDGPVVVSQPDLGDRFFLLPMLDAWTNVFASPGTRTTGNRAANFLVVGPAWDAPAPPGVQVVRSPTDLAWVVGRIEVAGPDDVPAVGRLQDQFAITPLSRWPDGPPNPAAVVTEPSSGPNVRARVDGMDAAEFFTALAAGLARVQTLPQDGGALAALARVGIAPGEPFDFDSLSAPVRAGLADAVRRVQAGMTEAYASGEGATVGNGWRIPPDILGDYGDEFAVRAVVAREGLGANLPADATYATAVADETGTPLDGRGHYVVRFRPEDLPPPVRAFWSLTVYDDRGSLVPVGSGRQSVSSHDGLPLGPDGSLEVHVGAPGATGVPFLGTPAGEFDLVLRLYWPEQAVLDGAWRFPSVQRRPGAAPTAPPSP